MEVYVMITTFVAPLCYQMSYNLEVFVIVDLLLYSDLNLDDDTSEELQKIYS